MISNITIETQLIIAVGSGLLIIWRSLSLDRKMENFKIGLQKEVEGYKHQLQGRIQGYDQLSHIEDYSGGRWHYCT